ncbi:MAG: sensor histidine kinase [Dehalococcoidales bacterium]|nr:sensor histidine kinase [Dehalococcoidales bacterium]
MKTLAVPWHERGSLDGNVAFVVVVIAAYFTTFLQHIPFAVYEVAGLIVLGSVYLAIGIYGFAYGERRGSAAAAAYFGVQIGLAAAIMLLSHASAAVWLLTLPLVAQSVVLPSGGWAFVVGAATVAIVVVPIGYLAGLEVAFQALVGYLAGVVFVVVFMQLVVAEQNARAKVERLLAELDDANRKLREYSVQVEELAMARERNRLARDIHDGLGHYLTAVNMQLEAARAVMEIDPPRALAAIDKAQTLTKEGLADVRRSVAALRASPTEGRTLSEALGALVEECRAAGVAAELAVTGEPRPLPPPVELTLYRTAQEGLTNVRKHARATRATLTVDYRDGAVRLVVEDDGVGAEKADGGFGLLGLRERVHLLGGSVQVRTVPGRGFTLEVEVAG